MPKKMCCQMLMIAIFAPLILFLTRDTVTSTEEAKTVQGRPDIILIDLPPVPGGEKMPGVTFYHDLHTESVKKNDCSVCHVKEKDVFAFKFKRTQNTNTQTDMAIYHDNCIGCHVETSQKGNDSGPKEGECRACHTIKPTFTSTRTPIDFDRSLHFRHESSNTIDPEGNKEDVNCTACHHNYNKDTDKIFYAKGEESSCTYCHKAEKTKEASNLQTASHNACVACHLKVKTTFLDKKAGPVDCRGCHDPELQGEIKKMKEVPRLKRNQPDMTLLTGQDFSGKSPEVVKKALAKQMAPVPFDHKSHELKQESCKKCHHGSLENCNECHTLTGDKKGGDIRLEQVMHDMNSDRSCMGCHNESKRLPECAGCHVQMPAKPLADSSCTTCHAAPTENIAFETMDKKAMAELAQKVTEAKKTAFTRVPKEKIPEKVTIGFLSKTYEPSEFPHARIIKTLEAGIEKSTMASRFHEDGTTLCQGCHHNAPASEKVQACSSCHGSTTGVSDLRPALKAAYHGQCITCHEKMKMDKIAATDCTKCHKKKD